MERGKFITVEGVDGAGKSTQFEVIANALKEKGIDFVSTREPGGPESAEKIRELLLNEPMTAKCELLLMFAARQENLAKIIRPALEAGKWVLCDRFTDASVAYQGYGRGRSLKEIEMLADFVHPDIKPDKTVIFDLPTEVAACPASSTGLNRKTQTSIEECVKAIWKSQRKNPSAVSSLMLRERRKRSLRVSSRRLTHGFSPVPLAGTAGRSALKNARQTSGRCPYLWSARMRRV